MRPAYQYAGWSTFDLTETKLHFATGADGQNHLIACIPTKWEKITQEKIVMQTAKGGPMEVHQYRILEWDEVEVGYLPLRQGVKAAT